MFLPFRNGESISYVVALHVYQWTDKDFVIYHCRDRGSDEGQARAPGNDLPIASIMRTKYGQYPEHHTLLDDFSVGTPSGLRGAYKVIQRGLESLE